MCLNSGATQDANHVVNLAGQPIGTTGSLFLYYSTESSNLDTGAGLDLSWTNDDVIAFTAAETFDFDVALTSDTSVVLGTRWGDSFGPAIEVTANSVTGLNAFTVVSGEGIHSENDGSGDFLDLGYDAGVDAFLFARVDWEKIGFGPTELVAEPGAIGIVNDGANVINPFFGTATFVVPEPAMGSGLLVLVLCGAGFRRRQA